MISNLNLAFEMLNQDNRGIILKKYNSEDFIDLQNKACDYTEEKIEELEKDIIEQFCLMDKNRVYILCKALNEEGDNAFTNIKSKQVINRISLLKNCDKEFLNWFEITESDNFKRKFAFYKIKTKKWKDEEGINHEEDKLLIFQCELVCFGKMIWVILKMPLIGLDNYKPYKFEEERNHIFYWSTEHLDLPIRILPLKEFYENFKDEPPLEKTGWNARSYKDEENEITEGDFGIRLDYQGGIELGKVYKSIDANFGPSYNEQLELSFIDFCKKNNLDINEEYLNFFRGNDNLIDSELIFRGIQSRCEYLVGTIGYFEQLDNGAKKEKIRYNIEKIKDETSGLIRVTHQGDEHFRRIFTKIKRYFDPGATR